MKKPLLPLREWIPNGKKGKRQGQLVGYAVIFGYFSEFWKYDPSFLMKAQRKKLGITGWKRFIVKVKEGDHG